MRRKIALTFVTLALLLVVSGVLLAQSEEYTVQYGDVLDVIAASANVSVACVAEASGLSDPNDLRPGDTLIIPADCPPYDGLFIFPKSDDAADADTDDGTNDQGGGAASPTAGDEYTVQLGDVLDTIAASANVSAACIAEASDLPDPHKLFPGDTVVIPSDCPPYDGLFIFREPAAEETDDGTSDQGGGGDQGGGTGDSYTVAYGDVLDLIGQRFNVSVTCLAEASGITDINKLRVGDTLVIDSDCPPYDGFFFQPDVEEDAEAPAAG